jgi:hypothetical protein
MNYLYGQKGMKLKGFFRFESKVTINEREQKKGQSNIIMRKDYGKVAR